MPYSGPEFKNMLKSILQASKPAKVLDIGVGAGKTGELCADLGAKVCGIEACSSYATQFQTQWSLWYEKVIIGEAKDVSMSLVRQRYDVVVFGDVLEHMWRSEALDLIEFWIPRSSYIVCVWPNGFQQDDHAGVASEVHRSEIRLADFVARGFDVVRYHKHYRAFPAQSKSLVVLRGSMAKEQAGVAY